MFCIFRNFSDSHPVAVNMDKISMVNRNKQTGATQLWFHQGEPVVVLEEIEEVVRTVNQGPVTIKLAKKKVRAS